jgi:hypothetical protein
MKTDDEFCAQGDTPDFSAPIKPGRSLLVGVNFQGVSTPGVGAQPQLPTSVTY